MERGNVSFKITAEDRLRLKTIAESLNIAEQEVLRRMLSGEYHSYDVDIVAQSESDPDETV